jgi:hypothetical protein
MAAASVFVDIALNVALHHEKMKESAGDGRNERYRDHPDAEPRRTDVHLPLPSTTTTDAVLSLT